MAIYSLSKINNTYRIIITTKEELKNTKDQHSRNPQQMALNEPWPWRVTGKYNTLLGKRTNTYGL